jgi:hypothetical protein
MDAVDDGIQRRTFHPPTATATATATALLSGFTAHSSANRLSAVCESKCHWISSTQFSNSAERGL